MSRRAIVTVLILWGPALEAQSPQPCSVWGEARQIGQLDSGRIREASGVAVSSRFPGRLYHVDDSSTRVYITDFRGASLGEVSISSTTGTDVEDLALGPCGDTTCLFIADIGDNRARRETIEVILVEEIENFPPAVSPRQRLRLRYPDAPHDAEALGVAPTGDIYLVSRNFFPDDSQAHAELFRLPAEQWRASSEDAVLTLEHLRSIELREWASELPGRIVSGLDISRDGRRMLLLTYGGALELSLDSVLSGGGLDVRPVALARLPQQESIAYLPGDRAFVYTTEAVVGPVPLMRVDCRD